MSTAKEIIDLLARYRFHYSNEVQLQDGIAKALLANGISFEREVPLTASERIDFLVGAIGIEVKIHQASNTVLRQLQRYALCNEIQHLLLITTLSKHALLPKALNNKALDVIFLGWSL